jgi:hypothetical protein
MTNYDPKMCKEIIELAEIGRTMTQVAAHWHVTEEQIIEWTKEVDKIDFKKAYDIAQVCIEAYYEDLGQKGLKGKIDDFKATAYIAFMKANFKKKWVDTNTQKIEIKNEVKNMTTEEIDQSIEALIAQRELNKKKSNSSGNPTSPEWVN